MADAVAADDRHEQARDLAEQALDRLVQGDEPGADTLLEQSRQIDPSAAAELVDDLEDDAGPEDEDDADELDDDEEDEDDDAAAELDDEDDDEDADEPEDDEDEA